MRRMYWLQISKSERVTQSADGGDSEAEVTGEVASHCGCTKPNRNSPPRIDGCSGQASLDLFLGLSCGGGLPCLEDSYAGPF